MEQTEDFTDHMTKNHLDRFKAVKIFKTVLQRNPAGPEMVLNPSNIYLVFPVWSFPAPHSGSKADWRGYRTQIDPEILTEWTHNHKKTMWVFVLTVCKKVTNCC